MKNLILFAFLAFALTGLLTSSISDSFADTENNGRDKGTKTAKGCDNGKGKASASNPNCGNGTGTGCDITTDLEDCDNDGIPNTIDACPNFTNIHFVNQQPDHDNDGVSDADELLNQTDPCQ